MSLSNSNILLSGKIHNFIISGRRDISTISGLRRIHVPKVWNRNPTYMKSKCSWEQRFCIMGKEAQEFSYVKFLPWEIWDKHVFIYDFKYFKIYREHERLV